MRAKVRHECERCGLVAELERAGRFGDVSYLELLQDYFDIEWQWRQDRARRHLAETQLAMAYERIDQLRALVNELPDPVPDVEFVAEDEEGCPF